MLKKSYTMHIKKKQSLLVNDINDKWWNWKKHKFKKKINQAKTNKPFKLGLRSQSHNPLNHKHRLSQEAQFSINLMLIYQNKKENLVIFKISEKSYKNKLIKITELTIQLDKYRRINLKKHSLKKGKKISELGRTS